MRRPPAVELLDFGGGRSFALRRTNPSAGWAFNWHRHPEWELTLIRAGCGVRFVGERVEDFAPGDLCLLPPELPHTWMSRPTGEAGEAVVLQVPAVRLNAAAALPEGAALRRLLAAAGGGLRFTDSAVPAQRLEELLGCEGLARYGGLLALFELLATAPAIALASHPVPGEGPRAQRLARVLALVEERLPAGLSQRRAAATAGMTPAAFSRFFHRATGRTFVEHLGRRRIAAACRDLLETDDRILDIALRHGWQGLAAFNRRFRALTGTTPSAWRRSNRDGR